MKVPLVVTLVCLCIYVGFSQNESCPDNLQLIGQMNSGHFKAENTLHASTTILPNNNVVLKAGTAISLLPGFSTGTNVDFRATTEVCTNNSPAINNALAWSSFPNTLTGGSTYTIELAYTLMQQGLIHLILADENWTKIGEASTSNLAAGVGTASLTFTLTGPPSTAINYLQARLLNTSWEEIGVPNLTEIIPIGSGNGAINSIAWNDRTNLPTMITGGATYNIPIDYSLTVPGLIYLQLMDVNFAKIGEIWTNTLSVGSGTVTLALPANNNFTSSVFYIQAQLLDANWMSIGVIPIQEQISNGTQFGLRDASTDPPLTEYHTVFPIQFNTNEHGNPNPPNKELQDEAGNNIWYGYRSNWFVGNNWRGPIKAFWGPVTNNLGYNFWMEWENEQQPINGIIPHAETDVRVQKHIWSNAHNDFGYPTRISELPNTVNCTAVGQWTPGSAGRAHINLTAWVSNDNTSDFDKEPNTRCDIIIHGWDNSGNMSANDGWNIIGTPTFGGITYDVLQRPGDFAEKASFNIVPQVNGQSMSNRIPILGAYQDTNPMSFNIDVKFFIDWLIDNAVGEDGNPVFDTTWHLIGCDWTITAQSAGIVDGVTIPASKGRWTFIEYLIPNLNTGSASSNTRQAIDKRNLPFVTEKRSARDRAKEGGKENKIPIIEQPFLKCFPNPTSYNLTITYALNQEEEATLFLYNLEGKAIFEKRLSPTGIAYDQQISIDIAEYESGFYYLTLIGDQTRLNEKVIIMD